MAWADFGGCFFGGHHALGLVDMQLVEQVGAVEELVHTRTEQGTDVDAGQRGADSAEGRGGHGDVADPRGEDDEEAEGLVGVIGGHAY